ncbi:MAG TPA: hypothetical protein PLQ57_08940 [Saprospiraceae bacterium]|nr:hypothetical protein [Saprospiraceae bacterium]HRG64648.1 hypothetical protein [Saprospiraceae bacterium]
MDKYLLPITVVCFLLTACQQNNPSKEAKPENPDARGAYELRMRGGRSFFPKYLNGLRIYDRMLKEELKASHNRDGGINEWIDLGPKNVGGRVRALAVDPDNDNVVFAGAAAGGIWKSSNGGASWTETTSAISALPVTSIIFDPFNHNILYATTGEHNGGGPQFPGVGVLKSTNRGNSWTTLPSPSDTAFVWLSKIVANPLRANTFYVAGCNGGVNSSSTSQGIIYRTTNGGLNWTVVYQSAVTAFISDLEINPNDTSEFIVGTLNGAFITRNRFSTVLSLTGAAPRIVVPANSLVQRHEVEYCQEDADQIYISGYYHQDNNNDGVIDNRITELWKSTNGGFNWAQLFTQSAAGDTFNVLNTQGNYSHVLFADPSNCDRALIGGINLWKWDGSVGTVSRISNWQDDIGGNNATGQNNSLHSDFHVICPARNYNGTNNSRVYIGNDGGIYSSIGNVWNATTNIGWDSHNNNINISQFYGGDISYDGNYVVGGTQDNSYCFDNNNNNGLQNWGIYSTGDGGYCGIDKNSGAVFTTTQNGALYRSFNGATPFCNILRFNATAPFGCCVCNTFINISENPPFIAPFEIHSDFTNQLFIAGNRLFKSRNNGQNWTILKPNHVVNGFNIDISAIGLSHTDTNRIWIGHTDGTLFRTSNPANNAASWATMPNYPGANYITSIAVHPMNANRVAVSTGGYNQQHIHITTDGGNTWTTRSLGFDMFISSITWHPENTSWLYVGTDVGIFTSENSGVSWSVTPLFSQSEGPVYTRIAELFWQGNGTEDFPYHLVAATHGRGMWKTKHPIRNQYYVDKTCNPCGTGSFTRPYATFKEAFAAAGSGSKIIFKTGGNYNEIPPSILFNNRIKIELYSGATSSAVIK